MTPTDHPLEEWLPAYETSAVASAGLRRVLWLALALSVAGCWLPAAAVVWWVTH